MLDCGLSLAPLMSFLPQPPVPSTRLSSLPRYEPPHVSDPALSHELKECCGRVFVDSPPEFCPPLDKVVDFSQLDAILISNYTCMLALPYITEGTGFRGQVYATEPTLQIGRFYLEELCRWAEGGTDRARRWKEVLHLLPQPLADASKPKSWRRLYTRRAMNAALARVRVVGYDEDVDIYGALKATAVSSGFCLGSANWVLRSEHEKIAYVSGSSTLTTHPRPANQAALRGCAALVLAALTQTPAHNPDNMLGDLCVHAAATLRQGGAVLLPVYSSGVVFDLLECLSAHLDGAGLGAVPMFLLSPAADAALAYANILAEWLSLGKQTRVYLPEEPFPHAALVRQGRLRHYPSVHHEAFGADFRTPCVVFCGHPSLRFGDAVHFVEMWADNPLHAIIFTEPDFPHMEALAPFRPLAMKAFHCPIDTSLNLSQAGKLVKELRPGALLLAEGYPVRGEARTQWLRRGSVAALSVRRGRVRAELAAGLAARLPALREVRAAGGAMQAAAVRCGLETRDRRLRLCAVDGPGGTGGSGEQSATEARVEWSSLDVAALVRELAREGIGEVRVERGAGGDCILHLPRHDTLLHLEQFATHVFCEPTPELRAKLVRALSNCLPSI